MLYEALSHSLRTVSILLQGLPERTAGVYIHTHRISTIKALEWYRTVVPRVSTFEVTDSRHIAGTDHAYTYIALATRFTKIAAHKHWLHTHHELNLTSHSS